MSHISPFAISSSVWKYFQGIKPDRVWVCSILLLGIVLLGLLAPITLSYRTNHSQSAGKVRTRRCGMKPAVGTIL